MTGSVVQGTVASADGTVIAFETSGSGPALVLIDAAGHHRGFSSFDGLIPRLATDFTVYHFDRRGRGGSGDTPPYAPQREIEDLAALLAVAGGSGFVYGFSSGGLLALHAAAAGVPIERMALLEPPIDAGEDEAGQAAFTAGLMELIDAGHAAGAVDYFLSGIGVPAEIVDGMRGTDAWSALVAVAPTLVYDSLIERGDHRPAARRGAHAHPAARQRRAAAPISPAWWPPPPSCCPARPTGACRANGTACPTTSWHPPWRSTSSVDRRRPARRSEVRHHHRRARHRFRHDDARQVQDRLHQRGVDDVRRSAFRDDRPSLIAIRWSAKRQAWLIRLDGD